MSRHKLVIFKKYWHMAENTSEWLLGALLKLIILSIVGDFIRKTNSCSVLTSF
jgi:hypothetical protein